MTPQPLVSVITTFLNSGEFLREAVESVLAQTYDRWEYILVDDGSSDGSSDIARSFVSRYPDRFRLVEHPGHKNCGISASRNLGLRHASGEIIATLDADDVWMPNKLERQVALLTAHPDASFVYGHTVYWRSWNGATPEEDVVYPLYVACGQLHSPPGLFGPKIREEIMTASMSSICFRREVIDRIGGFEDSFRGMFEDQCFLAKVFLNETVFVSDECWDKYRQHPDSTVSHARVEGTWKSSHLAHLKWVAGYLKQRGQKGGPPWKAVRTALLRLQYPRLARLQAHWEGFTQRIHVSGSKGTRID